VRENGSEKSRSKGQQKGRVSRFFRSPYSPDLSPRDFFLVPRLKIHLKGRHFGTLQTIRTSVASDRPKAIAVTGFQNRYERRKRRARGFPRRFHIGRDNVK